MKWLVLKKKEVTGNCFSIQAELTLSPPLKWCGILFSADSPDDPKSGYLLALTEDGFFELLSLAAGEYSADEYTAGGEGPFLPQSRLLQRRKSGILKPNNRYRITIKMQNDICTVFAEDITAEDASAPDAIPETAPWPVIQLPVPAIKGCLAAVVRDINGAAPAEEPISVLWENFLVESGGLSSPAEGIRLYQNPVLKGYADPDILYYEGVYYLYATSSFLPAGYEAYQSTDLIHWECKGIVMGEAWGMKKWYWAPDIIYRNGKFYLLASVNEHLGIAVSDSPLGPFHPEPNYLFERSIDGHYFVDEDGTAYIFYVSWREGKTYALYAMQMEPDFVTPILSTETMVVQAAEEWERQKAAVAEAPYVVKHKGKYYLTYSGSHFESKGYAVGYAVSDAPLGPYVKYEGNPILSHHYMAHGPGHHCIVTSPDGKEMFIVYHTHCDTSTVQPRNICIDRMRFISEEGKDDRLEVYGPTVTGQPYPLD